MCVCVCPVCAWSTVLLYHMSCTQIGGSEMGSVHIRSWYSKSNGSHVCFPPSFFHRMTGLGGKLMWTMVHLYMPHFTVLHCITVNLTVLKILCVCVCVCVCVCSCVCVCVPMILVVLRDSVSCKLCMCPSDFKEQKAAFVNNQYALCASIRLFLCQNSCSFFLCVLLARLFSAYEQLSQLPSGASPTYFFPSDMRSAV